MKKLIEFFVHRNIFGNLITVGVILGGVVALSNMHREAFPKVDFDIVTVTTIYPGASPQEIEKLITIPIEREAKALDGIKKLDSSSLESRSAVVFTLEPDVDDKQKVIQDIKDSVDRAKIEFPDDAEEPLVSEVSTTRTPIIEIAVGSQTSITETVDGKEVTRELKPLSEMKRRQFAKQLADKIELFDEVASVEKRGYRDREIHVEVDPEKLAFYNISVDEVINAIKNRNLNYPGGTIIDNDTEYPIRIVKEFEGASEMRNLILRANDLGHSITLNDVALVKDDFEKMTILEKANGEESTVLTVLKKEHSDAIDLVQKLIGEDGNGGILAEFEKSAPENLKITTFNDLSFYIKRRLNVLTNNVAIGMVLVAICLLFFLGWRVSAMVAIGIPFAFAITFLIMQQFDISINLISMFGLIIVSGMIVDDAIIVGENVYRHLEKGEPPVRAAIIGAKEMVAPMTGSISTTMVVFAPLMFMGGIMGKFIWYIPAAVIIALAASLLESFFILPAHLADITKHARHDQLVKSESSFEYRFFMWLQSLYRPVITWALKHRYLVLVLTFFSFLGGMTLVPAIGFELFPKGAIEIFFVKTEGPQGANLDDMSARIRPLERVVQSLPPAELKSFTTRVGIHQEQPNDPFTKRGKNYAQLTVFLTPEAERTRRASEIIGYLKRKANDQFPHYYTEYFGNDKKKQLLRITNRNAIEFYNADDLEKPARTIKVTDEFLLGGGINSEGSIVVYTGRNEVIVVNPANEKIQHKFRIKLRAYDAPAWFQMIPGSDKGLLLSDRGYLTLVDTKTTDNERITRYSDEVTAFGFIPGRKQMYLTTDKGSVDIYSVESGEPEMLYSITTAPRMKKTEKGITFNEQDPTNLSRVENASLSADGNHLYLAGFDGVMRILDLEQKKIVQSIFISDQSLFWAEVFENDKNLVWFSQRDMLGAFDLEKNKIVYQKEIQGFIQKALVTGKRALALGTYDSAYELRSPSKRGVKTASPGQRSLFKTEFKQSGGGPPVGAPVQIEVRGDEFPQLLEVADVIKEKLYAIEGVYDIRDNWEEGKTEFHVQINEKLAARAGVSVAQIASTLQAAFEGNVSTSIKKADEEIDIRVVFPENMRERLSTLKKVYIRNSVGNLVPITALASFKPEPGVSIITHSDTRRTVFVRANIDERKSSSVEVNTKIMAMMEPEMKAYPGVDLFAGGEYEDTQESMQDLGYAAMVGMLGVFAILVLLFGNLRNPRVIFAAIPLGLVGATVAFFLHKILWQPNLVFSFLASMGIVGLAGVVVNDSIVLVDFINNLRHTGMNKNDAIIGGCLSRLRAVILTTVTTAAGLLPTAYGIGGDDPFLRPMALAMAWGLVFATAITLVVIPVYYSVWEDRGFVFHHTVSKKLRDAVKGIKGNQ